jgi:hypothetical protein
MVVALRAKTFRSPCVLPLTSSRQPQVMARCGSASAGWPGPSTRSPAAELTHLPPPIQRASLMESHPISDVRLKERTRLTTWWAAYFSGSSALNLADSNFGTYEVYTA